MKKAINIILILILFPATITGQELVKLYKNGKITFNPDTHFSLYLQETPINNEINKFDDWYLNNASDLERKNFFKDFVFDQDGKIYLLASYSQCVVFKFDKHGNYISMFKYGKNPESKYAWGHSIDILDDKYIIVATKGPILVFDKSGSLYRTIKLDYIVKECIALRENKIAVIGEDFLNGSQKWKQQVTIIDIKTEKEKTVMEFTEEKENMFISVKDDKRWINIKNPFRKFNTCINKTCAGDLIAGYSENGNIYKFSPNGEEKGIIKLDYPAMPVTQNEKDEYYDELMAFNTKIKMEIRADDLKVIKTNNYFPEHWPYYYDIKVDPDDNILVFKYNKEKDHTFRVYQVYSKNGNFICETTIDSEGYKGPNIGRMKFFKGDLYGLLSQKNGTKEEKLVKVGLTGRHDAVVNQTRKSSTSPGKWGRVSGDIVRDEPGVYGTRGITSRTNKPGSRRGSVSWTDRNGNFWLYGGYGYAAKGDRGYLNDLWKYDGKNWTWVSGDNDTNMRAVYGIRGVAASTNNPGSRSGAVGWNDKEGNLWLFGGVNFFGVGLSDLPLNDLWKFDGKNWIWISGDNEARHHGIYGTRGIAASLNKPGARSGSVGWTDSEGNFWLFGGVGYAGTGFSGYLNDLWKFDGKNWTWVSGDFRQNEPGRYGTKGVASKSNKPGARYGSVGWIDNKGNLWLFGGQGYSTYRGEDSPGWHEGVVRIDKGTGGSLNDLWKFNGRNWTWVSGDNVMDRSGVYGTRGIAADTNKPGARYGSISWIDNEGNLWLFGGFGRVSKSTSLLNDLWKFDGTKWAWVSGDNKRKGFAKGGNEPEARYGSVSWMDSKGNLWLFCGQDYLRDYFNDLWKFEH